MGMKFWVVGTTFVLAPIPEIPSVSLAGVVLMVIGAVLVCLDK